MHQFYWEHDPGCACWCTLIVDALRSIQDAACCIETEGYELTGCTVRPHACRLVIEDLCLPTRDGVKQKRQLDEELIRRVLAAMNFLAGIYDVKRG